MKKTAPDKMVRTPKPSWLRRKLPSGPEHEKVRALIHQGQLHTVCQEAKCPNQFECFSARTATFLILGATCTRHCRFCNIQSGPMHAPDPKEPTRVAEAAQRMNLRYVVVTSVTRDDLPDGGAGQFAETILAIRQKIPNALVEVLIPDFQGDPDALSIVMAAKPDVLNHNIETVPRLYPTVRPEADYRRSLSLLQSASTIDPHITTKSGIMLGLGETADEVNRTLYNLRSSGCRIVTIGQYLQPTDQHLPVIRFIPPEEFEQFRRDAQSLGFSEVASGPFVRSSYHAKELYEQS